MYFAVRASSFPGPLRKRRDAANWLWPRDPRSPIQQLWARAGLQTVERAHVPPMNPGLLIVFALLAGMLLPAPGAAAETSYDERFIAPTILSQGEFALHLARSLEIPMADPAGQEEAMHALAALGIEPLDGWAAVDAPMTPQLVGELRHAVTNAAAAGRLQGDPAAALAAFTELIADLGLPLPAEQPPAYAGDPVRRPGYATYCDRAALDYYYGAVGVPYYTYCPPPPSYYYMYSWVPSHFYWHGFFFSGFFVIRDVHVAPRFKHRPPHPRFSDGLIGGRRDARPPRAAPDGGKGFRDIGIGRKPARAAPRQDGPRVIPRGPDRPRFSDGVLGGKRGSPPTVSHPRSPASASRSPQFRQPPPATRPNVGIGSSGARSPRAGPPPVSTPSQGAGRGWRDVVPGRR